MREAPLDLEARLAQRLFKLREDTGRSLDELAEQTGLSRATLSRFERGETSPSAAQLSRLASAYGLSASRVLADVEAAGPARLLRMADQQVWFDRASGFTRRMCSPPMAGFSTEVIAGELAAGARVAYDAPSFPALEHHLCLLQGQLRMQLDGAHHQLDAGDTLAWQPSGATAFENPGDTPARYLLAMTLPR
jgi:transcriptional regulator with XRE-family HTH domain